MRPQLTTALKQTRLALALSVAILLTAAVVAQLIFGDLRTALRYAQGDKVLLENSIVNLGRTEPGQVLSTAFKIRNVTSQDAIIRKNDTSCSCISFQGLPVTLRPGTIEEIIAIIHMGRETGQHQQTFSLSADFPGRNTFLLLRGSVNWSVVKNGKE